MTQQIDYLDDFYDEDDGNIKICSDCGYIHNEEICPVCADLIDEEDED